MRDARVPGRVLAIAAVLCAAHLVPGAAAFAVDADPAPTDPKDAWMRAARWNNTSGSFVDFATPGLGGGLEYSVDAEFCDEVLGVLNNTPEPTCSDVMTHLRAALDQWAEGHPLVRFVNVTETVEAKAAPTCAGAPGAEIDFFAAPLGGAPNDAGLARLCKADLRPIGTNQTLATGPTILNADITVRIQPSTCLFLGLNPPKANCFSFTALILHEVGHALGLMHPDQAIFENMDTDAQRTNPIPIDCGHPEKGLLFEWRAVDPTAVMTSSRGAPQGLAFDDIAGRNFLYPDCEAAAVPSLDALPYPPIVGGDPEPVPPPSPPANGTSTSSPSAASSTSTGSAAAPTGFIAGIALLASLLARRR